MDCTKLTPRYLAQENTNLWLRVTILTTSTRAPRSHLAFLSRQLYVSCRGRQADSGHTRRHPQLAPLSYAHTHTHTHTCRHTHTHTHRHTEMIFHILSASLHDALIHFIAGIAVASQRGGLCCKNSQWNAISCRLLEWIGFANIPNTP